MIDIDPTKNQYFLGFWFVAANPDDPLGQRFDWFASLHKDDAACDTWLLNFRFRYHHSTAAWDQKDKINHFRAHATCKSEAIIQDEVTLGAAMLADANKTEAVFVPIYGDGTKAMAALMKLPWCNIKAIQKDGTTTELKFDERTATKH